MTTPAVVKTGERYGHLVVLNELSERKRTQRVYECQCDCGGITKVVSANLRNGNTKSCGCLQIRPPTVSVGERYGRLTILSFLSERRGTGRVVECRCDCGKLHSVATQNLKKGLTKSCGCLSKDNLKESPHKKTHGHYPLSGPSPTYISWSSMNIRCRDPKHNRYIYYGGRGIKVCDRWTGDGGFENFLADMGERPEGLTIDRVNNDGDYEPGNCKWATYKEQAQTKRKPGTVKKMSSRP